MQDITLTLTAREQEAIAFVCDQALRFSGSNALQAVVSVHQALARARSGENNSRESADGHL